VLAPGTGRSNLPTQPNQLIGREEDLATARAMLMRSETRLLTLLGPGGVGKTRFGIQLARDLGPHFPDGSFFIALTPLSDPAFIPTAISQTLQLLDPKIEPSLDWLIEILRDRQILLLLDNFEHLQPGAPMVATMLASCPGMRIIVTSRASLRLYLEQQFLVPPLALPDPSALPAEGPELVDALPAYAAVQLFLTRAHMAQPNFALTPENAMAVAQICRQLDGLPLAIELAAARTKLLTPQHLLKLLKESLHERTFDLLSGGSVDLPARQQTIRSAIDWSYQLLTPWEQRFFRQLAVFVGGWDLDAAGAVIVPGSAEPDGPAMTDSELAILEGLSSLLDKSLISQHRASDSSSRFTMLETIREYAQWRLEQHAEAEELHERHAAYYVHLVQSIAPLLIGPEQGRWVDRLEQEHDNIRATLRRLLDRGRGEDALGFISAIWKFWQIKSFHSEGRRWMEQALLVQAGEQADSATLSRARVLWSLGWLTFDRYEHAEVKQFFEESLAIARRIDERREIGLALHGTGKLAEIEGDYQRAISHYQESLAIFRELDDSTEIAWSLDHMGVLYKLVGDYEQAERTFEESLEIFRRLEDRQALPWALIHLANLLSDKADYARAEALLDECLSMVRSMKNIGSTAWVLYTQGYTALRAGDYLRSVRRLQEGLAIFRKIENKHGMILALLHLGTTVFMEGNLEQARLYFEESLHLAQLMEDRWDIAQLQVFLGRIAFDQGDLIEAERRYREGLLLFRDGLAGYRVDQRFYQDERVLLGVAECVEELAGLRSARGEPAVALLGAAQAFRLASGTPRPELLRARYERLLATLQAQLDPQAFQEGWELGAAMGLEETIEQALR
jgi:predicted ATPase